MEAEKLRTLTHQDLTDLVEGAAIFSAGGGGNPQIGHNIVERLVEDRCTVRLIEPKEVPDNKIVINFACVGATASMGYRGEAALKTLVTLEEFLGKKAYAIIPVELGGFNTLTAVDVAARRGIPVVDADGAGRAVPEVHLKVYTIDGIPLAPMTIADVEGGNIFIVKQTSDSASAERIARTLATEWNQAIYTARRVLTGEQVKTSPILGTLSKAMRLGMLIRKTVDPLGAVLKETGGFRLFEGKVDSVSHETKQGFTWTNAVLQGIHDDEDSKFEFKAKNEVLAAYRNGKLAAIAPDIITPVDYETCKSVAAEKLKKDDRLVIIGIPAPEKWRTPKGRQMWKETLKNSDLNEKYKEIEKLSRK